MGDTGPRVFARGSVSGTGLPCPLHWGVFGSVLHCETVGFPDTFLAQKLWDLFACVLLKMQPTQAPFFVPLVWTGNRSQHTCKNCFYEFLQKPLYSSFHLLLNTIPSFLFPLLVLYLPHNFQAFPPTALKLQKI